MLILSLNLVSQRGRAAHATCGGAVAPALLAVRLDGLGEVDVCGSALGRLSHLSGAPLASHLRRHLVRATSIEAPAPELFISFLVLSMFPLQTGHQIVACSLMIGSINYR